MPRVRTVTGEQAPGLLERVRYDLALEAEAFARLAELDVEGCRTALGKLVDQLVFAPAAARQREIPLLLLDVLLMVNRRVHRGAADDAARQASRAALLEQFAAYDDPEDARHAFVPALNRLLLRLRAVAPDGHSVLVERARGHIEENYARRLSLSSVASYLHVSPNYLSRLFHRETGATLTSFVHRVRLEHARLLLASGGRTISEIAYLVGYQNYRDFYRNFVKYENASPRQVQRRLRPGVRFAGARPGDPE